MENKKKEKYNRILNSAIKIIGSKGFHSAKIKDISHEADVADGTIYNYFLNKEDLLITIFRTKLDEYVKSAERELKNAKTFDDKLYIMIEFHLKVMSDNPELANILQVELRQPDKKMRIKVRKNLRNYFKIVEEIITEGIKANVFNKNLNVFLAREMFFGTVDELVSTWVFTGQNWDLLTYADDLKSMMIKAFS
jgi:TetR/AcrR family fatty acid metabolism transcriptional regulator